MKNDHNKDNVAFGADLPTHTDSIREMLEKAEQRGAEKERQRIREQLKKHKQTIEGEVDLTAYEI